MQYRKAVIFLVCISCVLGGLCRGEEPARASSHKNIEGAASMWIEGDKAKVRIDYATAYAVQQIPKDNILHQYCVDFYDGNRFVGSYYWWNEMGSSLPSSMTVTLEDIEVEEGWRAVLTDRYFDVRWKDGKKTDAELEHWFEPTWWKFNSVIPKGTEDCRYTLQPVAGMPDMETYLRQSGFDIHTTLSFNAKFEQITKKSAPQNILDNK